MSKAKPYLSLATHLEDSESVFHIIWDQNKIFFRSFCKRHAIKVDSFQHFLHLAVYAHDIGKAHLDWQDYLAEKKAYALSHPLVSFCIVWKLFEHQFNDKKLHDPLRRACLTSILAHHSMLHNGSYQKIGDQASITIPADVWNEFTKNVSQRFPDFSPHEPITEDIQWSGSELREKVNKVKDLLKNSTKRHKRYLPEKLFHTVFLSILCACDNISSKVAESLYQANKDADRSTPITLEQVREHANRWIQELDVKMIQNPMFSYPNELQTEVLHEVEPYMVVRAGCGEGKTAVALQFANHWVQKGQARKLIVTLPTKFTTNAMFNGIVNPKRYNYPRDYVGISHSEVDSILRDTQENPEYEEESFHSLIRDEKFRNRFYHQPVTISTVDQLVYSFIHSTRYSDRAFGNILQSVVVFDEIHSYDQETLSGIYQCIQLLKHYQVPHLIMSATLPDSFIERLNQIDKTPYKAIDSRSKLARATPYLIEKINAPLIRKGTGLSEEGHQIIQSHVGTRMMIVCNQIERAKPLAKMLIKEQNTNVICYHSEFCLCDRQDKEKLIQILFTNMKDRTEEEVAFLEEKGYQNMNECILITTQICEMSLDISADVQLSEIAPIDSITQRGGREHRTGYMFLRGECGCKYCVERDYLPDDFAYKQYLFQLEDVETAGYPYVDKEEFLDSDNVLNRSWELIEGVYSFECMQEWLNQLYPEFPNLFHSQLWEYFKEDLIFGGTPRERYGDDNDDRSTGSFQLRKKSFRTIDVIPKQYESVIRAKVNLPDWKPSRSDIKRVYEELRKYTVSVKEHRFGQCKKQGRVKYVKIGDISICYLDVPYDGDQMGFDFMDQETRTVNNLIT
ncbi:CRISPR-associated helicase Cas3/CRISPR-associated endonuclease Cas3-HD [Thermoactinomyces sp. DSM 45891]|uniref:CRISPR-associated helicase/endonuclease Cas3 n=1 Tax=Thermoactinomyces sp. DSM 45891 TaxID=1761907 RepID=UPI00092035BC|nr:CRISPR-associated helicase/endonuclease Cas3 [Thermoactinomyces sp. DSM 45891]SFX78582.1 CRISPR-associated helicase Cas3/CRISPR-associated endonuclease Cas3-HD [Thermoactinomyces sp. DSM 45891]